MRRAWWNDREKVTFDSIIDQQPTVDAVEIVRCRDCAMCEGFQCRLLAERDPDGDHRIWGGFFCAYGERREE